MQVLSNGKMTNEQPRRVDLAAGFSGEAITLDMPRQDYLYSYKDLSDHNPFAALRDAEARLAPGQCIAGFFAYEAALALEPSLRLPPAPLPLPSAWFGVFDASRPLQGRSSGQPRPTSVEQGLCEERYAENAVSVRTRIAAGDVFQVNISHRQTAHFEGEGRLLPSLPAEAALSARYGARIDLGGVGILSASPELFLSLECGTLTAEPIKGTRPRSSDPEEDAALLAELRADPKDRAENIMIADLMRNDLAKVCADGSVHEPVICGARSLRAVHHLFSRIEGRLSEGRLFADALAASFPCGSVTGAPKWAAMDAIADIEGEGRGPYCGSIFYIEPHRAVASVAIRTAVVDEASRRVDVRSGGGVTILSDPHAEYHEALDKAYLFRSLTEVS